MACDVTSADSVNDLWEEAVSHFSANHVDLWVNNAGVMGEREGWRKCIDINLSGVLNGINVVMNHLKPASENSSSENIQSFKDVQIASN